MTEILQVRTEADYDMALARISALLGAEPYSAEDEELDRLSTLVEMYEAEHYPMEDPDPASLLEFLLDQQIVSREQLLPLAGGSDRLDAMLEGKQALTSELAGLLHEHSGLPMEYLMADPLPSQVATASD